MASSSANLQEDSGDERQHDIGNQIMAGRVPAESAPNGIPEQSRCWEWWDPDSTDTYFYEKHKEIRSDKNEAKKRRRAETDPVLAERASDNLMNHYSKLNFLTCLKAVVRDGGDREDVQRLVGYYEDQFMLNEILQ